MCNQLSGSVCTLRPKTKTLMCAVSVRMCVRRPGEASAGLDVD